ncbi:MAG: hypothetical protein INF91_06855, partial [Alphaproteobacteria bacterium]|nr:hypothetical protein [Alphaproteobacteria bacterium]
MTDTSTPTGNPFAAGLPGDPMQAFQQWSDLMGRSQQMMMEFWTKQDGLSSDPFGLMNAWQSMLNSSGADTSKLLAQQAALWQDGVKLWQAFLSGKPAEGPAAAVSDKRFGSPAWTENPAFDFLRQSYLIAAQHVLQAAG